MTDVTITPDSAWFRAVLTVPASASDGWLDDLAAAFAEAPERIAAQLLALHELNEQTVADRDRGDEYSADDSAGHALLARAVLAKDLPVDVRVPLSEEEARGLSEQALAAARQTFSARNRAGIDPDRKARPLRSVA